MSRPFLTTFDETRSPMTSPPPIGTPSAPLLAPAFKTNLNRAKSKRWVEAKTVDYGGGGWGDDEDFDEYDDYEDDGYEPSSGGQGYSQQGASYGRKEDVPPIPKPVIKLSDLGRPANGSSVPRVETQSPDLGIPLPPTPLEMEQQEQASRKSAFPFYNSPQHSPGGILQSFLPQIMTSRSSSPARGIQRAQTMGVDKPLPMYSPSSPPPPPAKDQYLPPREYYSPGSAPRSSSPGRESSPQPFGMGYGYSSMGPGTGQKPQSSLSTVDNSPDSPNRPMPLPKDSPDSDKQLPPWQNSPPAQSDSTSPTSPPLAPPLPLKNDTQQSEQSHVRYSSPANVEYSQSPLQGIKRAETTPLISNWGSAPQGSPAQKHSIPRRPTNKSKNLTTLGSDDQSGGNRSSQGSQLQYSLEPRRDQSGSPQSSQGRQSPEVIRDQQSSPMGSQERQSPEKRRDHTGSDISSKAHYPPPTQEVDYVDQEYYSAPNPQQSQPQRASTSQEVSYADEEYYSHPNQRQHHPPPQQVHQQSFAPQYQPMISPQSQMPLQQSEPIIAVNSILPPPAHSSSPPAAPPPLPAPESPSRLIRPSEIYARIGEEREKERRASDADSRSKYMAGRNSIDSTASGGVPVMHNANLSVDSQRGHLSLDPQQTWSRGGDRMPELRESNGGRPSSRQESIRRISRSGSRTHSRSSSRAEGSRPSSRQEMARSPSPFPPPTSALPPIPLTPVPASPTLDRIIDAPAVEHEKRQNEQQEKRVSTWDDGIISSYGGSEDIDVEHWDHQIQPFDPSSFGTIHESPQTQFSTRVESDLERSPSGGFKSMVSSAFQRQDTHNHPTPATPISPIPSDDDNLVTPCGGSIDDTISPILPRGPANFAAIQRTNTTPLPSTSLSPPPQHMLERSNTERKSKAESHTKRTPFRKSMGAERSVPIIVPMLDTQGSRGEIAEVTPDTPALGKRRDGPPVWVSSPQSEESEKVGAMERKDTIESQESQESRDSQESQSTKSNRSPEKDYLDTFLGELERAQSPAPEDTPPVDTPPRQQQTYDPSTFEATDQSQFRQQQQYRQQQPFGPDSFRVDQNPEYQKQGQYGGWQQQQLYAGEEEEQAHRQETYEGEQRQQRHPGPDGRGQQQQVPPSSSPSSPPPPLPFDPSSFGAVHIAQEQHPHEHQQPFDPSSLSFTNQQGVPPPPPPPPPPPHHLPSQQQQQQQYEQQQYEQQQYEQQQYEQQQYEQQQYQRPQQSQYEQHQQPYWEQPHPPPNSHSTNRESVGVLGLYDSYWTQEETQSLPPPPPVKNPRRPSAPDLQLLSAMSASSNRDSVSDLPPLPPPKGGPTTVRILPTPVSIPDVSVPVERPESTPASASEMPDSELLEMMIARRQFLARTQTGISGADGKEGKEKEGKEKEGKEKEGKEKGKANNEVEDSVEAQGDEKEKEVEGKKPVEGDKTDVEDGDDDDMLIVHGHRVVNDNSMNDPQSVIEVPLQREGTPEIRINPPVEGLEVIPQTRILGPESEGIEAITGPVIQPPKKEEDGDGEKTPMQSDYARELLNQFSRPQTLMLKETMPMPSGVLVMPPMPPKEEGEEEVPDVVDFSEKDEDEDTEITKEGLTVKEPSNAGSVDVGRIRQYMDPRDAARLPNSDDRVAAYNQARKIIGETPAGLNNWIKYMLEENGGAQTLMLGAESQSRPQTSNGRVQQQPQQQQQHQQQQHFTPMAKQPSAESDHHSVPSGDSPISQVPSASGSRPSQTNINGNGGHSAGGNSAGGHSTTPTPSIVTGGSGGSGMMHAPMDKAVDKAKGFLSRFGGKKGKDTKDSNPSTSPNPLFSQPVFQHAQQQQQGPSAGFQGHQRQVSQQLLQQQQPYGQPAGFQGHQRQASQQLPQQLQQPHGQPSSPPPPPPAQLSQVNQAQNDLAQLVQRGQNLQAQSAPQPPMLQPAGPPPRTSGYPPGQPPLQPVPVPQHRPRSQPQPPHLIIPGSIISQQRSVSGSGPFPLQSSQQAPQQVPQQMAVNSVNQQYQQPTSTPPQKQTPPPPPLEPARSSPHSHSTEDKISEHNSIPPPPPATQGMLPQQTQPFPNRSDSLYSQNQFQDSRTSSPMASQRPDRSDSLSSTKEMHQRNMRSDSLSRQQQLQQIPKRSDSLTSPPALINPDSTISPLSAHPHKAQGAFQSIPQKPSPPAESRYAGERRGQNAFAPRDDDPEEKPEEPRPSQTQQQPVQITGPISGGVPAITSEPRLGAKQTPQMNYMESHPGPYMGNEQQRGFMSNQMTGALPQLSRQESNDDDFYSMPPPPPKIQTQQPSPPRVVTGGGLYSEQQQQYQQGSQGGPPPQAGQGGFPQSPAGFAVDHTRPRQPSGAGQPGLGSPQVGSPAPQLGPLGPQGQYMTPQGQFVGTQFAPGDPRDPRGQFKGGPQFHHGPPFHPGQPISIGQQPEAPGVRRTSSGLMKTLSGVSGKQRPSIDSNLQPPNSAGSHHEGSTTSSQEKKRSSFFGNLKTKMDESVKSPQQAQNVIPKTISEEVKQEGERRSSSFMKGRKKDKGEGSGSSKEKKEKKEKKSHKKVFSMDVFGRTGSMLGKLTKSPSPTPSQASAHKPPPPQQQQQQQQQFQTRQVQPQHQPQQPQPQPQHLQQRPSGQGNYNPWNGNSPIPQQQGVYVENLNAQQSPRLAQGRGSPLAGAAVAPHPLQQQVQQQPQSSALPPSAAHAPPPQQGQPQYAPVPIPQGYARPQGEYAYQQQQQQQQQQQHLQQVEGHRQEFTNIDPRTGQSPSINISPSINRNPSQVSSQISDIRTSDSRNISPNLSRAGTQASRTYETTRSLSPNSEVGTQYGRRPSVREGDISEHPSSTQPSIKEGEVQNDSQRYQQPLPLPQSVAQVKNSGSDHEISPRSTPLPVSPPPLDTPFGPPPTQIEERSRTASPTPPPHPPKVVETKLLETEKTSPYDAGPSRQPGDATGSRDPSPAVAGASHASANERTPTLAHETEEEEYDFSTEKIAVNLDLHGETSKPFKKVGTDEEEEYTMSATAYPGQAWDPSYYGWN